MRSATRVTTTAPLTILTLLTMMFLALAALDARPAHADPRGVGLGVGFGVALPHGDADFGSAFNWGFFTDIPLISTFHISPSTLVYQFKRDGFTTLAATDVSLNFKFVIPLGLLEPFVGVTAGLTASQDIDPHVGALAGLALGVLPNIDLFAQLNYKIILTDPNVRDLQLFAGPLFRF